MKANKDAGGIDGISVDEIDVYLVENWKDIKEKILKRKYKPQPVLRVEIPKSNGGVRNLGIPTVVDRIIEQSIAQVLTPMFDVQFSEYSYGFRAGRRAQGAIVKLLEYLNDPDVILLITKYLGFGFVKMNGKWEASQLIKIDEHLRTRMRIVISCLDYYLN